MSKINFDDNTVTATCSLCGTSQTYQLDEKETETLTKYICYGRQMGYIQDLFPKIPAWIRAGAIDQYSSFCICPNCMSADDDEDDEEEGAA